MRFVNYCIPFLFTICTVSQLFWNRVCSWPSGLHTSQEGFCPKWLGHSRTLMCFFLSHSFVALAMYFGSLSCWNTPPRPIFNAVAGFNALALTVHGPVHRPFDAVQLSCPLSRKTLSKHNVSTSMFDGGDGVLGDIGSIPPPLNTASWVDAKELDFGLIWPQHFHPVLLWIIHSKKRSVNLTLKVSILTLLKIIYGPNLSSVKSTPFVVLNF